VLRIHEILVWIRIRIRRSMPLTNGSRIWMRIRILLFSSVTFLKVYLYRQVSLLGVRRVSLAPGIPASRTNPLPDSPSYPIGVRGQGGRGGAYCSPSLSPIMGRDGEKGDNPPSGSTTVTHSPWSCQQALSPSFCSHLATVPRLCSQGDKGPS
jgi:hypothetical protein